MCQTLTFLKGIDNHQNDWLSCEWSLQGERSSAAPLGDCKRSLCRSIQQVYWGIYKDLRRRGRESWTLVIRWGTWQNTKVWWSWSDNAQKHLPSIKAWKRYGLYYLLILYYLLQFLSQVVLLIFFAYSNR